VNCTWCGQPSNDEQGLVNLDSPEPMHDDCETASFRGALASKTTRP
jgi:hypothetical protein